MTMFLKFLVYSMQTVDGAKDSALNIYKALRVQEEKKFCKSHKIKKISEKDCEIINKRIYHLVMRKAMMKYKILRIRSKISFYAFLGR